MRILHVITRSEWGGAQKVVYLLATKQKANGHKVTVLCGENGRLVEELKKAGIQVSLNPYLHRKLSWRDSYAFLLMIKEARRGYDLIHAHSSKAGVLARLIGKLIKIPVCFTVHGFGMSSKHSPLKQLLYHKIEANLARFTDALVFVSFGNLEVARENRWLNRCSNYSVIFNGIEIPSKDRINDASRRGIRNKYGIPYNALLIGNLARVAWIKNPDFWFQVAKVFIQRYPESYFIWFGAGQSEKYQAEEHILFVGEVEDIDSALESLDILFLTSHSEGMPLAVLEGMARGLPVLLPDIPGLKECGGAGGKVYRPGDIKQALESLTELRNPLLRAIMGERGRHRCYELYSVDRMVCEYEALYFSVLKKS